MSLIHTTTDRHGLYIGGKKDAKARSQLQARGITHILNVTPVKEAGVKSGVPNFFEASRSFTYKRIPVYDASTSDLLLHADGIVGFISTGLCHGSVLVHCQRGCSRSVTCTIFYLMRKIGMPFQDAISLIQQRRPEADPIPAFISQLKKYEEKCRQIGVLREDDMDSCADAVKKRKVIGPTYPPGNNDKKDTKRLCGPARKPIVENPGTIGSSMSISSSLPPKAINKGTSASTSVTQSYIGPTVGSRTEANKSILPEVLVTKAPVTIEPFVPIRVQLPSSQEKRKRTK